MTARIIRIALASLVGLMIAAGIAWWQVKTAQEMTTSGAAAVGGPFALVDHTGRPVTDADFRGKHLLVYFGYTYCPDVCPTELGVMAQAMDRLGPLAEKVQPLFITVDPKRDTVAHMAGYVELFHPRLVGLTGTPEQTAAAAKAYRVYHAVPTGQDAAGGDYLVDHSSFIYLMGPDGAFQRVFAAGAEPDQIAADIRSRLAG